MKLLSRKLNWLLAETCEKARALNGYGMIVLKEGHISDHSQLMISILSWGETPETLALGETPDISEFAAFKWYEWVKYRDQQVAFPDDNFVLARYLGPSFDIGPAMTAKLLIKNGQYIHRSTFRGLTDDELADPNQIKERKEFDISITEKLGASAKPEDLSAVEPDVETPHLPLYEDNDGGGTGPIPDREDLEDDHYDQYINADVLLPTLGTYKTGKVTWRKRDAHGRELGKWNAKAALDTREYIVEFPDGSEAEYAANTIAENMYAQCDLDGQQHILMKGIVDCKKDSNAIPKAQAYVVDTRGIKSRRKTTKGWSLCVQWRDGTSTWEPLATLKESNRVEVAEYAISQGVDDEPAFAWWVPFTLKKRESIISAVNARYHKRTHKFGIEMPKSVTHAKSIDTANGNTHYCKMQLLKRLRQLELLSKS